MALTEINEYALRRTN